jgi:hypothetical protein
VRRDSEFHQSSFFCLLQVTRAMQVVVHGLRNSEALSTGVHAIFASHRIMRKCILKPELVLLAKITPSDHPLVVAWRSRLLSRSTRYRQAQSVPGGMMFMCKVHVASELRHQCYKTLN